MIKRTIISDIRAHLEDKEITLITGARQTGKTTLMEWLMEELRKRGEPVISFNLDFENDRKSFETQESLLSRIRMETTPGRRTFIFIDEIQRKENAGIFMKGLYDMKLPYKWVLSGSGSIELREKIHESLAGRKQIFELHPVSFFEFLEYRTAYRYQPDYDVLFSQMPGRCLELLNEYLNFGGYPAVVLAETMQKKLRVIQEIYESYLDRDIRAFIPNSQVDVYSKMIRLLGAQSGQLINLTTLSNESGITSATLKKYLWYAEKTFFIKLIQPFYRNQVKEITHAPVIYLNDHGMRNYTIGSYGNIHQPQDFGFAFQHLTGSLIQEAIRYLPYRLHFWRTKDKAEVDFVISRYNDPLPVEVKFSSLKNNTLPRSLRSFIDRYNPTTAWVINTGFNDILTINKTTVFFFSIFGLPAKLHDLTHEIEKMYLAEEAQFPYMLQQRNKPAKKS